jgi:hypothetical protein
MTMDLAKAFSLRNKARVQGGKGKVKNRETVDWGWDDTGASDGDRIQVKRLNYFRQNLNFIANCKD